MTKRVLLLGLLALLASTTSAAAQSAEICGNGIDDNGNGMVDEGCYPTLTTGVCESPLSCGDTGMVSWGTGSLHYDLPPDIAPNVPYGPKIGMRRYYLSQAVAGMNPTSVNKTPFGARWGFTYLTYLYDPGSRGNIVVHNSQGRDVLYSFSSSDSNYDYYTPQYTDHVIVLKHCTGCGSSGYYLQLLTGETLRYNTSGQLIEIWDNLKNPNKVLVTWDSTSSGNVSTVTDASGERRLLFSYSNGLMTSMQFQLNTGTSSSPTWMTQHTTSYEYDDSVTKDASSNWYVPANATEWTNLLTGTGISNPSHLYLCQESSGNLSDSIGTTSFTHFGSSITYQDSVSGWSRKGLKWTDGSGDYFANGVSTNNTSAALLVIASLDSTPSTSRVPWYEGANVFLTTTPVMRVYDNSTVYGTANPTGSVHVFLLRNSQSLQLTSMTSDQETLTPTWANVNNASYIGGVFGYDAPAMHVLYAAQWVGTSADLTASQASTIVNLIQHGPTSGNLSSVTIGSQVAQKYSYNGSNYLTQITDGANNQIVAFAYSSTTNGQVDLVTTSRGAIGFDYAPSRTSCAASNNVMMYFNQGNSTACSADSDCGSGYMCGGKTGSGTTGTCFLAGRCLTTSTVNNETVITNVAAIGPGGGSCSGACADVMQYAWATSSSGLVSVIGREDALTNFTSVAYCTPTDGSGCTVGMPKQIWYGATDSSGTSANRTVYFTYDTQYGGRVTKVRRQSDVSTTTCANTDATCATTTYNYSGTDCSSQVNYQLSSTTQAGWTYNSSGSATTYSNTTSYSYDCVGRVTEIDGAISGIKTTYDYYSAYSGTGGTGTNQDNFVKDYKAYTSSTAYLEPQVAAYDFWGHPTSVQAPDGNFTCDTYDSSRGYLASRRKAMAGQTSCSTTNSADLTTNWTRDSWLRLTQLQRPDGSCLLYSYDTMGRIYQVKRRDDCNASSSGDMQQWSYTADSLVSEVDTYDSGNTLTAKQPYSYFAGRQLQNIVNPVNSSYFTGLVYDSAGKLTEVDGSNGGSTPLSKSVYHYDNAAGRDGRVTSEDHYKTSSTYDTWSLLYDWLGSQSQVQVKWDSDGGYHNVAQSIRDDLNRLIELTSPDLANPFLWVFDAAGRVTTMIEDLGGGANQLTHTFTYDNLGRQTVADYSPRCPTGTTHPTITRSFDALPSGVSCPSAMTNACTNLSGRLAYVSVALLCSSSYSDGSLDQQTYYAYDAAGRVIEEYITDDGGRTADHLYQYTKNGALSQVTTPSGAVLGWTYGLSGNNSSQDLVSATWRTNSSTKVTDTVKWFPFGPLKSYNQENTISGTAVQTVISRNLAYRITDVKQSAGTTTLLETAISEDALGRVTSRVYTGGPTGMTNSYFLYDEQSQVICETTDLQTSCPTTGSDIKYNHSLSPPFMNAGDWKQFLRPENGSTGTTHSVNSQGTTYGTSHQITSVNQNDGTPTFGNTAMSYDARGNRTTDNNSATLTHDERDYTYSGNSGAVGGPRNVTNVRGQYMTSGVWHYYDVASAFDAKNRRVYKSFYDETTQKTATWFFYYDPMDRLTEVRYTPDTSQSSTYSLFQLFWIGDRLTAYWQVDYPTVTTSKRYVGTDETGRPLDMWSWPSTGDATRAWTINPSAWGFDSNLVGPSFQPILFPGQYEDPETAAYENDGTTIHRPGIALNDFRTYDPFAGGYLQIDPMIDLTRSSYVYAFTNPVGGVDFDGRRCSKALGCVQNVVPNAPVVSFAGFCEGFPGSQVADVPMEDSECLPRDSFFASPQDVADCAFCIERLSYYQSICICGNIQDGTLQDACIDAVIGQGRFFSERCNTSLPTSAFTNSP